VEGILIMSWRVTNLIRDSILLHDQADLESEDYNDLLLIEKEIKLMRQKKLFSAFEDKILNMLLESKSLNQIALACDTTATLISSKIGFITDRISYCMGNEFTDAGYIENLAERYNLTPQEVESGLAYMHGRFSGKILSNKRKINV
jgi:hypothetical protein